jgi:2-polyprenyl-3-methyl-5-hydroxy-6-metoxy-1,4-benzoquinol methylase
MRSAAQRRRLGLASEDIEGVSRNASLMTKPKFDQAFWEQLWSKTLREHADKLAHRPPNAHLMAEVANLPPGRALDAGCGHGPGAATAAASQVQVSVEGAVAALDANVWELVVAEERPRAVAGTGADAVIRAHRRLVSADKEA